LQSMIWCGNEAIIVGKQANLFKYSENTVSGSI